MATEQELIEARKRHADQLEEAGTRAYPNGFRVSEQEREARRREALERLLDPASRAALPEEEQLAEDAEIYPLFGRVIAKRGPFLVIRTPEGDAQALVRKDRLSEEEQRQLKVVDLADHVAVEGPLIRTRKGDGAVSARTYRHLGKALLPPPDKWHGLKDVEKRYRERYVDLFANPEVARVFVARSVILRSLRRFLDARGFLEVETPLLQPLRGGATARAFSTHHNALDMQLYLRVAPELYLKRLLVGGLERVYELGRTFRNEGISTRHNPEFTILEFYMAYATYEDLIVLTESLVRDVDRDLREAFDRQDAPEDVRAWLDGRPFTLAEPFARAPMRASIAERLSRSGEEGVPKTPFDGALDLEVLDDPARLAAACEAALPSLDPAERKALSKCESHGERIYALFELLVEPLLTTLYRSEDGSRSLPVFVTGYPFEVSPLARRSDAEPGYTDRFELFIEGRELANAFSELNDPEDQAERFRKQLEKREGGDEEAMDFDADYIRALSHGMPPAAGFGLGVDRLVMLLCQKASIRDVLLFPLMRPEAAAGEDEPSA